MAARTPSWIGTVWQIVKWTAVGVSGVAALLILFWIVWLIGALLGFWGHVGY